MTKTVNKINKEQLEKLVAAVTAKVAPSVDMTKSVESYIQSTTLKVANDNIGSKGKAKKPEQQVINTAAALIVKGLKEMASHSNAYILKVDGKSYGINTNHTGGYELEFAERIAMSVVDADMANVKNLYVPNLEDNEAYETLINTMDAYVLKEFAGSITVNNVYSVITMNAQEWAGVVARAKSEAKTLGVMQHLEGIVSFIKAAERKSTVIKDGKKYLSVVNYKGEETLTLLSDEPQTAAVEESIETAVEVGVPVEDIITNEAELEQFMGVVVDDAEVTEEVPATDESSVAVENTEKDDEQMTEEKKNIDVYTVELEDGVEVEVMAVADYNKAMVMVQEAMAAMQTRYEEIINRMADERHVAVDEMVQSKDNGQANLITELKGDLSESAIKVEKLEKQVKKLEALRKADEKKIAKLRDETGRAKTALRAHKAREISADSMLVIADDLNVGAVIKGRAKVANGIEEAAASIHENAPAKIEAAANATKDGIQWTADKAKDAVDVAAKATNWTAEKLGNTLTATADVIAPTKKDVAKAVLKRDAEKKTVTIAGQTFRVDANGKFI